MLSQNNNHNIINCQPVKYSKIRQKYVDFQASPQRSRSVTLNEDNSRVLSKARKVDLKNIILLNGKSIIANQPSKLTNDQLSKDHKQTQAQELPQIRSSSIIKERSGSSVSERWKSYLSPFYAQGRCRSIHIEHTEKDTQNAILNIEQTMIKRDKDILDAYYNKSKIHEDIMQNNMANSNLNDYDIYLHNSAMYNEHCVMKTEMKRINTSVLKEIADFEENSSKGRLFSQHSYSRQQNYSPIKRRYDWKQASVSLSQQLQQHNNQKQSVYQSILASKSIDLNNWLKNYPQMQDFIVARQLDKQIYLLRHTSLAHKNSVAKRIEFSGSQESQDGFDNEYNFLNFFKKNNTFHQGTHRILNFLQAYKLQTEGIMLFPLIFSSSQSLARSLFQIRHETLKGEAICRIFSTEVHKSLLTYAQPLKDLLLGIAQALDLFTESQYIYGGLRMENVLVQILRSGDSSSFQDIRLSNFESAFQVFSNKGFSRVTPEYMPPEVLQEMLGQQGRFPAVSIDTPYSIDVWSFGCIILEILTFIPVWMPQRCLVHTHGCNPKKIQSGLFSHPQRRIDEIYKKQLRFCNSVELFVKDLNDNWTETLPKPDQNILDIIPRIFTEDPSSRISPKEIISKLSIPERE